MSSLPNFRAVHPQTAKALEHVDAAMFTGDPGETAEMWEVFDFYIQRWTRQMVARKPNPDGSPWWDK